MPRLCFFIAPPPARSNAGKSVIFRMGRSLLYFLLPLGYLIFWVSYLLGHYFFYAENDPGWLEPDFQLLFASNRKSLLFSELLFPLAMALSFIALFTMRLRFLPIRIPFLIAQFLSLEFFAYRQLFFSDQYANYQQLSQWGGSLNEVGNGNYWLAIGVAFVMLVLTVVVPPPSPSTAS